MADWAVAAEAWAVDVAAVVVVVRAAAARAAVEEPVDRRSGTRTPRWKRWVPSAGWAVGVRVVVHRARAAKVVAVSLVVAGWEAVSAAAQAAERAAVGWAVARAVVIAPMHSHRSPRLPREWCEWSCRDCVGFPFPFDNLGSRRRLCRGRRRPPRQRPRLGCATTPARASHRLVSAPPGRRRARAGSSRAAPWCREPFVCLSSGQRCTRWRSGSRSRHW